MKWRKSLFVFGAIFFPLLIGAASPNLVERARTFATVATAPLLEIQDDFGRLIKEQMRLVTEWPLLRKKVQALNADVNRLKTELEAVSELRQENERLSALLDLKQKTAHVAVAARVIGYDPSNWSQFIVINRGSSDGVRGDMVLIHPNGLVGKVIAAGPNSARAILLTDRQSRVSALNQRTRDVGLIEGTGSAMFKMTYLDPKSDIQIGDTIVSSGLGGIYPKGIVIGRVELVGEDRNQLSLYALVKPFVSFAKLEELLCVYFKTND